MNALRLQVPLAHRWMLGTSLGLLFTSALILWRALPHLPAQIPMHFTIGQADRLAPTSDLWALWWILAGTWLFLLGMAFELRRLLHGNRPVLSAEHLPAGRLDLGGTTFMVQLIVTLFGGWLVISTVIRGLGGPNLDGLAVLAFAGIPVIYRALHRTVMPPRPVK